MLKIWILEREDGDIVQCTESEAYDILHRPDSVFKFKVIGTAEAVFLEGQRNIAGKHYAQRMKGVENEGMAEKAILAELKSDRDRYLQTLDKFIFEELLDKEDPKVKRVNLLIDGLNEKVEKQASIVNSFASKRHSEALQEQIEIARGNVEQPSRGSNVVTPGISGDNRQKVINSMTL
jgi:hypothetical protein